MSQTTADTSSDLLGETLTVASARLGSRLTLVGGPFPGSRRTLVVRAADGRGGTVVVKRYLGDEGVEAHARAASALEALAGFAQTPSLVAECLEPRLVVVEDLGEGADRVLRFLRTAAAGWALPELADAAGQLVRAVGTRYAAADVPFAPAITGGAFR